MIGLLNTKKTKRVFSEIRNFFYILSRIDKHKNADRWKEFKLRSDWIGRIYTVISLREEDTGEMEEVQRFKVLERLRPINEYLTSLGLAEVIVPNITPVEGTRSYLVIYSPYFSQLSYMWLSFNVFLPIGLIYQFLLS
jgi:hypothetical protein